MILKSRRSRLKTPSASVWKLGACDLLPLCHPNTAPVAWPSWSLLTLEVKGELLSLLCSPALHPHTPGRQLGGFRGRNRAGPWHSDRHFAGVLRRLPALLTSPRDLSAHDGWASVYCCFQALPREAITSWGRLGLVLVLYQAQMARGPDSGWPSVSSPARGT